MKKVWDVEKIFVKNTVNYLAVLEFFLNTHHINSPTHPRLPSAVKKDAKKDFFLDKQTMDGFSCFSLC